MHDFLARFKGQPETVRSQSGAPHVSPEVPQGITIEQLNLATDTEQVAELYASVFASPPWNEYTRCGECNTFSGKETTPGGSCPHCQKEALSLAYPLEQTMGLVHEASEMPNATMYVAKQDKRVIGFTWGYTYPTQDAYFEDKSHYSEEARSQITDVFARNDVTWPVYYFAEIGISEEARGQGLANILAAKHVEKARELDQSLLMTTNWQAKMISVAKRFDMRLILGPESYFDKATGEVVRTGNVANYIDAQNPDRILFFKPREDEEQEVQRNSIFTTLRRVLRIG